MVLRMNKNIYQKRFPVTICNDHIGGSLGESIFHFFLRESLLQQSNNEYSISDKGWDELELIGVNINALQTSSRKKVSICVEKNFGIIYEHIGAHLGSLLLQRFLELAWIHQPSTAVYELSQDGLQGLQSMGVKIKPLISMV